MHFLFPPADYRHFYGLRQTPPWYILSPESGINLMKMVRNFGFICLICVGTSGNRAVIKVLCSSSSLFTMWVRHFSLGCEEPIGRQRYHQTALWIKVVAPISPWLDVIHHHIAFSPSLLVKRRFSAFPAGQPSASPDWKGQRTYTLLARRRTSPPAHGTPSFACPAPWSKNRHRVTSKYLNSNLNVSFLTSKYGLISSKVLVREASST